MGQTYQRSIRPGELGTGNPDQYDYDKIAAFMQGADDLPLSSVARAYLHAKYAFEQTEARMAQHVKQLNLVWQGGAQELGVADLRLLTEAAGILGAVSQKFADAMDNGSTAVQRSRHTMPRSSTPLGAGRVSDSITDLAAKRADDRAAQQHLAKTNTDLATAFAQIPADITIDLPKSGDVGTRFGGGEAGAQSGGQVNATGLGGPATGGSPGSAVGSVPTPGFPPSHTGGGLTPGGLEHSTPGASMVPPDRVGAAMPVDGQHGNASDLAGAETGVMPSSGSGAQSGSEGTVVGQKPGGMPRPSVETPIFNPPVSGRRPMLPSTPSWGLGGGAPRGGLSVSPQTEGAPLGRASGRPPGGADVLRPGGVLGMSPGAGPSMLPAGASTPGGRAIPSAAFGLGASRFGTEAARLPASGVLDNGAMSTAPKTNMESPPGQGRGANFSGMPMGAGGATRRDQQEREIQFVDDEDLWSDDSLVAPRVIGETE
ncbi:hypothetical protein GCM10010182_56770 [Actinomadura cremea]|nr:hypothetical protein GCM10010182_56770 [Actinomadura cremea]